jgi:flagellar hook protein FlgE
MSINSAMLAGVTGLVANSSALAAISDNIANVNTVAYKRNQVNFGSVVTAQVAGRYSAGGVSATSRQYISQQGLIQAGTSSTDLAISGDGFFVATQKATGITNADTRLFTRSGSFSVDANGYLVNDANLYLQGWPVQANGTFDINPSDLNKLSSINVRGQGTAVAKTTSVEIAANLNKGGAVSAGEAAYLPTTATSMTDYAANPATGTRPDFSMEMNVIDSAGATRKVAISFLKTDAATPNTWHAEIYALPTTDVTTAGRPGQLASGTVKFTQDGAIDLAATTLFGAPGAAAQIALAASGTATTPRWHNDLGIAAQSVTLDLDGLKQFAQPSTVTSINSDGAGVGNVVGVEVDEEGIVSAVFDNSQIRTIGKIALATFPNADGLQGVSGNAYRAGAKAGQMLLKEPGFGAGSIAASSLEASTVDLSAEFTGLILTQKAYSASSKIISTADQMLEELMNIKR